MSSRNLHCDLLENPGRYFFILESDSRASLCIQTCDTQGEDIRTHIIDCLAPDREGNLYSIIEDGINDAVIERQEWKRQSYQRYNCSVCCAVSYAVSYAVSHAVSYAISSQLAQMLSSMPDLMDWIISSILNRGRNLVLYPSEDT